MSTIIYFAGGDKPSLRVQETPEDVQSKINAGGGLVVPLTPERGEGLAYVNPATIAYFGEATGPGWHPVE
jgi:hypothetical protein